MPPDKDQLRLQVEKVSNLPTLPGIVTRIAEMVDSPETTGRQLGREIAKDQVISAKVLKLVNSGFYGFSEPISTIQHAVTLLGFNTVKSLVLSSTVLDLMKDSLPGLWEHSLACARTCSIIAGHIELDEQEEISTAGLLHDLGKVILRQTMEREFRRIANYIDRADMLFYQAEEKVLGVNHGRCRPSWSSRSLTTTTFVPIATTPKTLRYCTWPTSSAAPRRSARAATARSRAWRRVRWRHSS